MMITRWIATGLLVGILLFSSSTSINADAVEPTDASASSSVPTWVLVHGGYGAGWIWYKMQCLLETEGYPVYAVDLTSHGTLEDNRTADSVRTIEDWAAPLFNYLSQLTEKVIVVTHSLGGAALSVAMEMYPDKIAKAVFIAALMPQNGEVVAHVIGSRVEQLVDSGVLTLTHADGALNLATSVDINNTAAQPIFYPRCQNEDLILLRDLLTPFPYRPFLESATLTDEKYGSVPRYYIKCGLDNMISTVTQQKICDDNPPKVQFVLSNADHAPMFSDAPYLYFILKSILKY